MKEDKDSKHKSTVEENSSTFKHQKEEDPKARQTAKHQMLKTPAVRIKSISIAAETHRTTQKKSAILQDTSDEVQYGSKAYQLQKETHCTKKTQSTMQPTSTAKLSRKQPQNNNDEEQNKKKTSVTQNDNLKELQHPTDIMEQTRWPGSHE